LQSDHRKDVTVAVTARAFLFGNLGGHKTLFVFLQASSFPLKTDWQRHVLGLNGYLELGMFDHAALFT
jgi:hypothetical protein